ncbi:MAG TPA: mannitol dehydrogenase family protein, partial [Erysipelothrix sp.]|nr:mannitol dehydrogenase family protein [Erysipelothrix sp.]
MKLTHNNVWNDNEAWREKNVKLPKFNYQRVKQNTQEKPQWVHFGAGNIFRAYQSNIYQTLLNNGDVDTGIIVAEGFDYEIIDKVYRPNDNNGLLVTLKVNGETEMTVISSVVESLKLDQDTPEDFVRLQEIFANPSLQMASFTITEKGYNVHDLEGEFYPDIKIDLNNPIEDAQSYIGKLVSLLHHRFVESKAPIALVSMDNVSRNGDFLKKAILSLANVWLDSKAVTQDFIDYLNDETQVSYPWSMIDKITPRPDDAVKDMLLDLNFDANPIITTKGTYIAPFVNAEESEYLVIEDNFPNGKPPLE